MQERIQWEPLETITRELEAIEERKGVLEGIISDYAETGRLDQRTIFLYTDEEEEVSAEAAIEHIKNELDDLEFQRESRLVDKAELAVQEVQIRSLLKVIDGKTSTTDAPAECEVRMVTEREAEEQSGTGEDGTGAVDGTGPSCDHSAACYDLADFYDRTDRIPANTSSYSEDLVKRYIQSITVKAKCLVVKFKAGVEVKVQA